MTSITGDPQSGAVSPKTPCDSLGFLGSTLQNPNWISKAKHILPPTRSIVVGASRMLASVIGFESSSSSSSSSDATRDNVNDDQDVSSQGVHAIEDREPHFFTGKDETKCLIEQLLTQESFSRQEYDKLTDIIKSRVVDSPSIGGLGLGRLNETPERTDVEIQDVFGATKLEEKSGSNSKSGSALDMDKSSMQTRPPWPWPWPSHSKKNIQYRSPSSIAMPLFKGKTPYSIGANFLYSSKRKRGSPGTGSWNIHDEIRKVRSKATEETMRTPSSSKLDRSSFPLEPKTGHDSILATNLGPAKENKSRSSKSRVGASRDLPAKPASQLAQDAFHNDALPRSATLGFEQNQDKQTIQVDREQNHKPIISKEYEVVGSRHDNAVRVVNEKCELLCETSTEAPMVNETNAAVASGSQQHQSTPTSKGSLAGNSNSGLETQQKGNELIRYNTRNRRRRK